MNYRLSDAGTFPKDPYPRTELQMVSKLCEGEGGTLTLVSGSGYSSDITDRTAGIFGMNTRKHVMDSGLKADYLFNGFESCVVDCLKGKDSVLVYDDECHSLSNPSSGIWRDSAVP